MGQHCPSACDVSQVFNADQWVAWSPDGKWIVSEEKSIVQVRYDSDGTRLSTYGNPTLQVWNAADGTPHFTCKGHFATMDDIAWDPSGKHIVAGISNNAIQV